MIGRSAPNRWIFDKILSGEFVLCVSNEIMLEYEEVLAAKTTIEVASNFIDFLTTFPSVEQIHIFFQWRLIKNDPDDDKFVDCAFPYNICPLRGR